MKDYREDFFPFIARRNGDLQGLSYELILYQGKVEGDHTHCELCWETICNAEGLAFDREGYYCAETRCWICKQCFNDFKSRFNWSTKEK